MGAIRGGRKARQRHSRFTAKGSPGRGATGAITERKGQQDRGPPGTADLCAGYQGHHREVRMGPYEGMKRKQECQWSSELDLNSSDRGAGNQPQAAMRYFANTMPQNSVSDSGEKQAT